MGKQTTRHQIFEKVNELQHLDWEYSLKLLSWVGVIDNQMELLLSHPDSRVSEIAVQTRGITSIIKDRLNSFDFEIVEDIRKLAAGPLSGKPY